MQKSREAPRERWWLAAGIAALVGLQGVVAPAGGVFGMPAARAQAPAAAGTGFAAARRAKITAAAQPSGSGLELSVGLTAGGDGTTCGTDASVTVNVGDVVDFCYTVTNRSATAMAYSTLVDSVDGTLFSDRPTAIAANGGTYVYHRSVTAKESHAYEATWTAQDILPGYTFADAAPDFVDISQSGSDLGLDDDGTAAVTLPFQASFYGVASDQLCVANNGVVVFGVSSCSVIYYNQALPGLFGGAALEVFWDDLSEGGGVYWATRGEAPHREVIVEWDRDHYGAAAGSSGHVQAEAILGEDGSLSYQYRSTTFGDPAYDGGISATVGVENEDGSLYTQYSDDTALPPAPFGIAWTLGHVTSLSATASVATDVGAPAIGVTPASVAATAPSGSSAPVTATLSIANAGTRALDWKIAESAAPRPAASPGAAAGRRERATVLTGAERERAYAERKRAALDGHPVALTPPADRRRALAGAAAHAGAARGPGCEPGVAGIVIHDDGVVDTGYSGVATLISSFVAVDRFTPSSYPGTFTSACVDFYSDSGTTSVNYELVVYDDTGAGGGPGNELGAIAATGAVSTDFDVPIFNEVDLSPLDLDIKSGSVYIGVHFDPQTETRVFVGADESPATPRGVGYVALGQQGQPPAFMPTQDTFVDYRSLMVRAVEGVAGCVVPQDVPWLSVAPAAGTIEAGGAAAAPVLTLDPSGLADGVYAAMVCVASNDRVHPVVGVPVEFAVGDVHPAVAATPAALAFSVGTGGSDHATLSIANAGDPGTHLAYTLGEAAEGCDAPSDVAWLSAAPTSGSIDAGAPASIQVSVDAGALAPGSYTANLCLSSNDPAQPSLAVPVSLAVAAPDRVFADGFDPLVCEPVQLLADPGFEASLDGGGPWTGTSTNFGSPFCTVAQCGDGSSTGSGTVSAGPHGGDVWAWLGGTGQQEQAEVSQTVTIPAGAPRFLDYYLWIGAVSGRGSGLDVLIDGTPVASHPEPAAAETGYAAHSVDVSAFADGRAHTVAFRYAGSASNFNLDDVTIDCAAPAAKRAVAGSAPPR